jgi:hypothetical protein
MTKRTASTHEEDGVVDCGPRAANRTYPVDVVGDVVGEVVSYRCAVPNIMAVPRRRR